MHFFSHEILSAVRLMLFCYQVGDLGLSKVKCQTLISGGVRGTLPWMAPELLNGSSTLVSEKVIFSFHLQIYDVFTIPYCLSVYSLYWNVCLMPNYLCRYFYLLILC